MIKALDELNDFYIMYSADEEIADETIIFYYLAVRLKPLLKTPGYTVDEVDRIINRLADHYANSSISLDLMINAVYNYINSTGECPSDKLLKDNIEELLDNYAKGE